MGSVGRVITAPFRAISSVVSTVARGVSGAITGATGFVQNVITPIVQPVARIIAPVAALLPRTPGPLEPLGQIARIFSTVFARPTTVQFPGLPPGQIPSITNTTTQGTPFLQIFAAIVDVITKGASTIDRSIGDRLANLVGLQNNQVEAILGAIFPEMVRSTVETSRIGTGILDGIVPDLGRSRLATEHMIFNQFPSAFGTVAEGTRRAGVSERTLAILKSRRWIPLEFTTNPDGFDDDFGEEISVEDAVVQSEQLGRATAGRPALTAPQEQEIRERVRADRARLPAPAGAIVGFEGMSGQVAATETHAMVTGKGLQGVWQSVAGIPNAMIEALVESLGRLLMAGIETGKEFLDVVRDAAESVFGGPAQKMLTSVKDRLEPLGPIFPGQQSPVAQKVLGDALLLGLGAHGLALGFEFLSPLKHMGAPQMAALMVDLAGFAPVVRAQISPVIRAGIETPATFEAQEQFRTNIPPEFVAGIMFQKRDITEADFRQILAWHGFSEGLIEPIVKGSFTEPRLFDIQRVVDDTFVDEAWLRLKILRAGYDDTDVELITDALLRNATRGIRIGFQKELQTAFARGIIDRSTLEAEIDRLDVGPEGRDFMIRTSQLQRAREDMEDLEKVFRGQAEEAIISIDDYRTIIQGLGFDQERIDVLTAIVDTKIRRRAIREERADIKRVIRDDQRTRIRLAQESFRRGLLTEIALRDTLVVLGVDQSLATAMAALEAIKREPVPRRPAPLTPQRQKEKEDKIIRNTALLAFRKDQISEAALLGVLLSTELPIREAEALVTRELARKAPTPEALAREPREVVEVRRIRTQAIIAEFREEKIDLQSLRSQLVEAGHSEAVAAAFVEREEARIPLPTPTAAPPEVTEPAESRQARRIRTTAAVTVFRQGGITPSQLNAILLDLGNAPEVAAATVQLESVRRAGRPTG